MSDQSSTQANSSSRRSVGWAAAVIALSVLGLMAHNAREFGLAGLGDVSTGTIPMTVLAMAIVILYGRAPRARKVTAALMAGYGLLNLIGGGLSVLPLPFLPFVPEQSFTHYLSHVIYALSQIPLIWVGLRHMVPQKREAARKAPEVTR